MGREGPCRAGCCWLAATSISHGSLVRTRKETWAEINGAYFSSRPLLRCSFRSAVGSVQNWEKRANELAEEVFILLIAFPPYGMFNQKQVNVHVLMNLLLCFLIYHHFVLVFLALLISFACTGLHVNGYLMRKSNCCDNVTENVTENVCFAPLNHFHMNTKLKTC